MPKPWDDKKANDEVDRLLNGYHASPEDDEAERQSWLEGFMFDMIYIEILIQRLRTAADAAVDAKK